MDMISPRKWRTRRLLVISAVFALVVSGRLYGQSAACEKLETAKAKAYGFAPSQVSDQERKLKATLMDEFWETAKTLGPSSVPCLQQMIGDNRNDPFFLFDASSLLLNMDSSPASLQAISAALVRTDLKDIQIAAYLRMLLALSRKNVDIGPLAEKYMVYPSVDTYLPEHAMQLDRTQGALLLYGSMDPQLSEKYLEALAKQSKPEVRGAAVFALALNLTEASFRAFHAGLSLDGVSPGDRKGIGSILRYEAPKPEPNPKLSREQVLKRIDAVIGGDFDHPDKTNPPYVAGDTGFETSAHALLTPADLPLVYEARRKSVRGVSDESLDEYMSWSLTIFEIINRNDLYKDLRVH
jgi:hypothetical protein